MNKKISLKTIEPKDLWNVFRGSIWMIIAAAILTTGIFYALALFSYSPLYSSSATMYLIPERDSEAGPGTTGEFVNEYTIAFKVIDDCDYLLKSRTVLNKVGEKLGVANGYGAFSGGITIYNPESTRVLEVTAVSGDPDMAKKIADGVCEVGAESINNVLGYGGLQLFEEGTYSTYAINQVSLFSYIKHGLVAAVLVYVVFLAMFLFDNYIHTEEDIERYLGLTVLGDIPDADAPKKKNKYKYKYKYGRYKSYRSYKRNGYRYQSSYGEQVRAAAAEAAAARAAEEAAKNKSNKD